MATIRLTPEQQDYLKSLYLRFGSEPFSWSDAKNIISQGLFRVFCDSRFIVKNGMISRKVDRLPNNKGRLNTTCVNTWRMDPDSVERFIYGERGERKP